MNPAARNSCCANSIVPQGVLLLLCGHSSNCRALQHQLPDFGSQAVAVACSTWCLGLLLLLLVLGVPVPVKVALQPPPALVVVAVNAG